MKGNEANVVCILKVLDRTARSGVLEDISTARAFSCVQGKFKPTIKAKLDVVKNARSAKVLPFKTAVGKMAASAAASDKHGAGKRAAVVRTKDRPNPKQSAASRKRVPSGVDSDGRQHRFSKPKKPIRRTAKARVAQHTGSRTKLAA